MGQPMGQQMAPQQMGQQMGHRMSGSSMGGQMGGNPYMSPAQPQQPAMQANPYMSGGAVGVNMQRQQSGPSTVNVNPYMQSQAPPQNQCIWRTASERRQCQSVYAAASE